MFTEVTDQKRDDSAITKVNGFIKSINAKIHMKRTTHVCKLLVQWKGGSIYKIPLKDFKQYNPVELSEYTVANGISYEPSFRWWFEENLRRLDMIISKVNSKYWCTSHKLGIWVPKTVK